MEAASASVPAAGGVSCFVVFLYLTIGWVVAGVVWLRRCILCLLVALAQCNAVSLIVSFASLVLIHGILFSSANNQELQ